MKLRYLLIVVLLMAAVFMVPVTAAWYDSTINTLGLSTSGTQISQSHDQLDKSNPKQVTPTQTQKKKDAKVKPTQTQIVDAIDLILSVSQVSSTGALLTASVVNGTTPDYVWFEVYSESGQTVYKSGDVPYGPSNASTMVDGIPLLSGQSYTAKAFSAGRAPSQPKPLVLLNASSAQYEKIGTAWDAGLKRNPFNLSTYQHEFPKVFGDVMGGGKLGVAIAVAVIMMFVLVAFWLRQQDTTIPMVLGLIMGLWLSVLVPEEFKSAGYTLTIICIVALFYQLYRKKE